MAEREVKVAIQGDSKGLTGAVAEADAQMVGLGERLASFGKVAGLAFAAAGVGAVVGLAKIGADFDSAFDKIRIGTGATGKQLEGLQGSFKNVFASVPASMDTVSTAITTVNQKLGLTGKPLEDLSRQFVNLSRITNTDLGANVKSVTGLFNQFGIATDEQGKSLDMLFRIQQKTGVSVGDMADQLSGAGTVMRAAGISFNEGAAIIGVLGKAGLDVKDVLPAMSKSLAKAAKDGKPAAQVLHDTFDAIKNAPDDTKAAGAALDVFGAKAGPKLAQLIREGKLSYEELMNAVKDGGDTINAAASDTDDWREKLEILKNKVLVALEPVASAVFDGLTRAIDFVTQAIDDFAGSSAWATIQDVVPRAFGAVVSFVQTQWPKVVAVAETVVAAVIRAFDAVRSWFEQHWTQIASIASSVWDGIVSAAESVAGGVVTAFKTVVRVIGTLVDDIIGGFQNPGAIINVAGWQGVALRVGQVLRDAADIAVAAFGAVKSWFQANWPTIKDVFDNVWHAIQVGFQWLLDHKAVLVGALLGITAVVVGPLTAAIAGFAIAYTQWDGFRKVVDAVVSWVRVSLLPAFQDMVAWITENTGKLAAYISERWEAIKGSVETIVKALTLAVGVALAPLIFIWTNAHDQIMEVVNIVWQNIQLVIGTAMRIIKDIIDVVLGLLSGDWGLAWDGIKDIPLAAFEYMKGVVTLGIEAVKAILEGALALIAALWSLAWEGIKTVLAAAWEAMKTAVSTAIGVVVQFFIDLPGRIIAGVGDLLGLLVQKGKDLIQGLWNGIQFIWGQASAWIAGIPNAAVVAIGDLAATLLQKGKDLLGGLQDGAIAVWSTVSDWLSGLGESIVNAVGDLSAKLYNKGRELVGGFISGILSRIGDVASAIASVPGIGAINDVFGGSGGPDVTPVHKSGGGIVPGMLGQAVPAIVHGGEVVLNSGQQRGLGEMIMALATGGGGVTTTVAPQSAPTLNLTVNATAGSADELAKAIVREQTWLLRTA